MRKKIIGAWLVIFTAITVVFSISLVHGDPIPEYIAFNSVNVTKANGGIISDTNPIKQGEGISATYNFSINPDYILDTDTGSTLFTLQIPQQIDIQSLEGLSGDFIVNGNLNIGSWSINKDNLDIVNITINNPSQLKELTHIEGFLQYSGSLDATNSVEDDKVNITFPGVDASNNTVSLPFDEGKITTVEKKATYDQTNHQINYEIAIEGNDANSLKGLLITDTFDKTYQELHINAFLVDDNNNSTAVTLTETTNGFTYTLGNDLTADKYTLKYSTTVKPDFYFSKYDTVDNSVHVSGPNTDLTDTVTTSISKAQTIKKESNGVSNGVDNNHKVITWSVTVNQEGLKNLTGLKIQDSLPKSCELVTADLDALKTSGVITSYTKDGDNLTIEFAELNAPTTITYKTIVPNDGSVDYEWIDMGNGKYDYFITNTAKLNYNGTDYDQYRATENIERNVANDIIKRGIFNYATDTSEYNTIDWTVNLTIQDPDQALTFYDDLKNANDQEYIPGSLKVNGVSVKDSDYYDATNKVLSHTFPIASDKTTYIITYSTKVTHIDITTSSYNYSNTATIRNTQNQILATNTGNVAVNLKDYMYKSGSYNYEKDQFDWMMYVGKSTETFVFNGLVVTDILPFNHSLVADSIYYSYEDGTKKPISEIATVETKKGSEYGYTGSYANSNVVKIKFNKEINKRIYVYLSSKSSNTNVSSAKNVMLISSDEIVSSYNVKTEGINEDNVQKWGATINGNNKSFLDKKSAYQSGATYIDFSVVINQKFGKIPTNAILRDALQEGLVLKQDSIDLYKASFNSAGDNVKTNDKIELDNDSIEYNVDTNTFTFKMPQSTIGTNDLYVLKFRVNVYGLSFDTNINNSVSFSGDSFTEATSSSKEFAYKTSNASQGITGINLYQGIIIKRDATNLQALAGCEFTLYSSDSENGEYSEVKKDGKTVVVTSRADGVALFTGLENGKYYKVVETKAANGYVIDENDKTVYFHNINNNISVIQSELQNNRVAGSVNLTKTGKENGQTVSASLMENAEFDLYQGDTKLGTYTTNNEGKLSINNLTWGDYYLVETKAPVGFEINDTHIEFSVNQDNLTNNVTIEDSASKGTVDLTKTGKENGVAVSASLMENAEFDLYKGDTKLGTYKTDDKGKISIDNLTWGDYYLVETKAPVGFEINDTQLNFTVDKDHLSNNVTIEDNASKGTVNLTKTGKENGIFVSAALMENAEFDLYQGDTKLGTYTTNNEGKLSIDNLTWGDYYLVETKVPTGFEINNTHINFTVDETHITNNVSINDTAKKGSVDLTKTGKENGIAVDASLMENAEFDLYKGNNKLGTYTTNNEGKLSIDNLTWGDYYLVETKAPVGFEINDTHLEFSVDQDHLTNSVSIEDVAKTGSVILEKKGSDGENIITGSLLEGTEFTLFKGEEELDTYITDENGKVKIDNLEWGDYYLLETKAPTGFGISDERLEFSVDQEQTRFDLNITDEMNKGFVELIKLNEQHKSNKELVNAKFDLYVLENDEYIKTDTFKTSFIDDQAKFIIDDLNIGKYYLVETEAPKGYVKDDTKIYFEIDNSNNDKLVTLEFVNEKEKTINKTNVDTGDHTNKSVYLVLGGISLIVIIIILIKKLRKK